MGDLATFSLRVRALGDQIVQRTDETVRKAALAVDQAVVLSTPVDTGRARSNWIVQLGSDSNEVREPQAVGSLLSEAQAVISQYKGGTEIHITNNLPYINRLNEGWSAQAPSGFVETAVQVAFDAVRKAKLV